MRPSTPSSHRSSRPGERDRIAEAIVALSAQRSFAHITVPMLLERAEVDEAAFRRHFDDLEDCFCQVFEEMRDECVGRVLAVYAGVEGWRNKVRAVAHEMLRFLGEDLDRARFITFEALYSNERARLLRDQAIQGMIAMIDQGRYEMEDPDSLTPYTAETIGGAIFQRFQSAAERGEFDSFVPGLQETMYMVVLPYLGPEAAAEELEMPTPPFPDES